MNIYINGIKYSTDTSLNILQLCDLFNIDIPRFCYHDRLSIAGNCRLCLVEIEKNAKLIASCAMSVSDGMSIYTNTPLVKKAREGILEFLLINHPLDCPICDQGGECDLQDQTLFYGSYRGRFLEYKRAVENKNCGPLIKTVMTRCIQCTRCIRFAHEISGISVLGTSGRGNNLEISTYINKLFDSELSGNVIDLCPVGALTSKPSSFTYRPWELKSFDSIDISDSFCSNIKIDTRGFEILRILPSTQHSTDFWITDRARFSFDGLNKQRLLTPFQYFDNNSFLKLSWIEAVSLSSDYFLNSTSSFFFTTDIESDLESICFLKEICFSLSKKSFCLNFFFPDLSFLDFQHFFVFRQISSSDVCFFFFMNPKKELPLLNLTFRKLYLRNKTHFIVVGSCSNFTYPYEHLSIKSTILMQLTEGTSFFTKIFQKSNSPHLFFGNSILENISEYSLMSLIHCLFASYHKTVSFSFVSNSCGQLNKYFSGVNSCSSFFIRNTDFFFSLNVCVLNKNSYSMFHYFTFVIFLGAFGYNIKRFVNLVLPSSSFVEKEASFFNIFSVLKKTSKIINSPGDSKEDSIILEYILKKLYSKQTNSLSYYNSKQSFFLSFLTKYFEKSSPFFSCHLMYDNKISKLHFNIASSDLNNNFYINNTLSSLSKNMSQCSKLLIDKSPFIV